MPKQHPANEGHPRLSVFLWRFFTGHHLDGVPRTNATWLRRGTAPAHHVNWWNAKPRAHRMVWRWCLVFVPATWIFLYLNTPTFGINVTALATLCVLPYLFHHGIYRMISLMPRHRVVFVHDNVLAEDVNTDLDDISIGEQIEQDDDNSVNTIDMGNMLTDNVQAILDAAVTDATKRTRRGN